MTSAAHSAIRGAFLPFLDASKRSGPRVVVSHNAPVINPNSKHKGSPLTLAFNSLDIVEIIETHQPVLWVYGHTHECDDQMIGRTRIISNQLGYSGSSWPKELDPHRKLAGGTEDRGYPFDSGKLPQDETPGARLLFRHSPRARRSSDQAPPVTYSFYLGQLRVLCR
jgi:hypothetical protein